MRGRCLREFAVGLHLDCVNEIGEFDRVLNEEHRDIIADQIEIAFFGVEFDREAAHVTREVAGSGAARNGRDAYKHRRLLAVPLKEIGFGVLAQDWVSSK